MYEYKYEEPVGRDLKIIDSCTNYDDIPTRSPRLLSREIKGKGSQAFQKSVNLKEYQFTFEVAQSIYNSIIRCEFQCFDMLHRSGLIDYIFSNFDAFKPGLKAIVCYIFIELILNSEDFGPFLLENIGCTENGMTLPILYVPLCQLYGIILHNAPSFAEFLHGHNITGWFMSVFGNNPSERLLKSTALLLTELARADALHQDARSEWILIARNMLFTKAERCQACALTMMRRLSEIDTGDIFDDEVLAQVSLIFGSLRCVPEVLAMMSTICSTSPNIAINFFKPENTTILSTMKRYMSKRETVLECLPLLTQAVQLPDGFAELIYEYGFLQENVMQYYHGPDANERSKKLILEFFCAFGANYVMAVSGCEFLDEVIGQCIDYMETYNSVLQVRCFIQMIIHLRNLSVELETSEEIVELLEEFVSNGSDICEELICMAQTALDLL